MFIFSTNVNPQPSSFSLENLTQKAWEKAGALPESNIAVRTVGMVALATLSALNAANESAKITFKIAPALLKSCFDNTPHLKKLQIGSYFPESVDIKRVYQHAYRLANFALEILLLSTYGIVKTGDVIKRHKAIFKPYPVQVHLKERFDEAKRKAIECAAQYSTRYPWLIGLAGVGVLAVVAYVGGRLVASGGESVQPKKVFGTKTQEDSKVNPDKPITHQLRKRDIPLHELSWVERYYEFCKGPFYNHTRGVSDNGFYREPEFHNFNSASHEHATHCWNPTLQKEFNEGFAFNRIALFAVEAVFGYFALTACKREYRDSRNRGISISNATFAMKYLCQRQGQVLELSQTRHVEKSWKKLIQIAKRKDFVERGQKDFLVELDKCSTQNDVKDAMFALVGTTQAPLFTKAQADALEGTPVLGKMKRILNNQLSEENRTFLFQVLRFIKENGGIKQDKRYNEMWTRIFGIDAPSIDNVISFLTMQDVEELKKAEEPDVDVLKQANDQLKKAVVVEVIKDILTNVKDEFSNGQIHFDEALPEDQKTRQWQEKTKELKTLYKPEQNQFLYAVLSCIGKFQYAKNVESLVSHLSDTLFQHASKNREDVMAFTRYLLNNRENFNLNEAAAVV